MNILHYTLGLPPNRSGGLTKYATDLMIAQINSGDHVSLLYPGDYTFWRSQKKKIIENNILNGISVYEIKNPSPVPLSYGIQKPDSIYNENQKLSKNALDYFFKKIKPEIIHIHTLMGLPLELMEYCKENRIKIVYTSHDYYGLCPKVNFINQNADFCYSPGGSECAICNQKAPSSFFLRLRNSNYLLKYKNKIPTKIKEINSSQNSSSTKFIPTEKQVLDYNRLLSYYNFLFGLIDCFHFNSSVSKEIFENYFIPKKSIIIPISHADIHDSRKKKQFNVGNIRLAFIGRLTSYKGFTMLKNVLCTLNNNNIRNWSLQVWWGGVIGTDHDCNKIIYKGKYSPDHLEQVFSNIDLLIVPSIWKETFSLITLEALSFGVPVIVSNNVGAKDLVSKYDRNFVFDPSEESLYNKLIVILNDISILQEYNMKISSEEFDYYLNNHTDKLKSLYLSLLPKPI